MKKSLILIFLMICLFLKVQGQKATVSITLKNSTAKDCHIWIPVQSFFHDYLKRGSFEVSLNRGVGAIAINIDRPAFAYLSFSDNESNAAKRYLYKLYLSKGYNLALKADAANGDVAVAGLGSNNNQPLLSKLKDFDPEKLYGDTLPNRIIESANNLQKQQQITFNKYINSYKPSSDFINNKTEDINYIALNLYYDFKENNKFQIQSSYKRNKAAWQKVQDSLMKVVSINNPDALGAASYHQFLMNFVMREKERLWGEAHDHPVAFFKEYYHSDTTEGRKLYAADQVNLLCEKIVNKNFSGAVKEHAYALIIDNALGDHNPQNLVSIYNRFSKEFPQSNYVRLYRPVIDSVHALEQKPLASDMIFLPQNGTDLKTFNDVLKLAKGKTVLLDMWGTWCGPCRNEISDNGAAIKTQFLGKELSYFYVANHDLDHIEQWKKLIAYLDMKGTHILANASLSKDIMDTVKGPGYPTYVIIKKDGTWELSKAGYPMKRDVLFKQLEEALAQ